MNTTRIKVRRTAALFARLVVLASGLACILLLAWDTPVVAGNVGSLILGVRVWVIGFALLAAAAVWIPDDSVEGNVGTVLNDRLNGKIS